MPVVETAELDIRERIAFRVKSVRPEFEPGIVTARNCFALEDTDYADLCRSKAQPKIRGVVIEYLGWTESPGAEGYVIRRLRYSLVFLWEVEQKKDLEGGEITVSYEEMVACVERVAAAFRGNTALVRDNTGNPLAWHHYLQADNDFDLIRVDEKRMAHFLAASLEVEVDANANQQTA